MKNSAPFFNRFYYELTPSQDFSKLTVRLVNENPAEMCSFEWIDATESPTINSYFSNECQNKENCFFSLCRSMTFGNIPNTVKAVKIRVLKLGMKPNIAYQNNIYLCNLITRGGYISVD